MQLPKWLQAVLDILAAVLNHLKDDPKDPPVDPDPPVTPDPPDNPNTTVGQQLVESINKLRVANGCPKVVENIKLTQAASKHAAWMASTNTLSHTGKDGSDLSDRIHAEEYPWSMIGEDIAMGFKTADDTTNGWMHSPGHRQIMLNKSYEHVGVGYAVTQGRAYWVADFATPKSGASETIIQKCGPLIA